MSDFRNLSRLRKIAPDDYRAIRKLRAEWRIIIEKDLSKLDVLYADILQLSNMLLSAKPHSEIADSTDARDGNDISEQDAYVFFITAATSDYLRPYGAKKQAQENLIAYHDQILDRIRRCITTPNRTITRTYLESQTGTLADCGNALMSLYVHHSTYGDDIAPLRGQVAVLIPDFQRAFPDQSGNILLRLLEYHPKAVASLSDLLEFHLLAQKDFDHGTVQSAALDMMSLYSNRDDFWHKNAVKILAPLLPKLTSDDQKQAFINRFVYYPLYCTPKDPDAEIAQLKSQIAATNARIANPEPPETRLFTPEQEHAALKRLKKELRELETDPFSAQQKQWRMAVQRVAVSAITRKVLETISKAFHPYQDARLKQLISDAEDYKNRPKTYLMPKRAENQFRDFGLKLLVIEELMYRQNVLTPKFDIYEFSKEYDKREISVEDDGYAIIPEAKTYFANLPIPPELLKDVTELHQSSGLDGGAGFMRHLHPFWDPGCGDTVIAVTHKAVEDLTLLPNLQRISGLENSRPGPKLLQALAARNIVLIDEEGA